MGLFWSRNPNGRVDGMYLLLESKAENRIDSSKSMRMYYVGLEARPTFGRSPAVDEAEGTDDAESNEPTK